MAAIEQALLLRELIEAAQLSQREAARQCGRDVSWVQRLLLLLAALPNAALKAVRGGVVSSWAVVREFAPLARANDDHAMRLLAGLDAQPRSGSPRASCAPSSTTTRAPSRRSAKAWSNTRACSSTA